MPSSFGLRKTSLIDFPGRLSCVLFSPGCNFRCPYCHNPELVEGWKEEDLVPLGEILGFLDKRKRHISGVVLSGGEPLIHQDLPRIADAIRKRGLLVKLDTNGSFPDRIAALKPDYVALDLKTDPARYDRVAPGMAGVGNKVVESMETLRRLAIPFELRLTCAPGILGLPEVEAIARLLEKDDLPILQAFRGGKTLDPAWQDKAPFSEDAMYGMLAILRERAPKARIRGA